MVRAALRRVLATVDGVELVGEAENGVQAIQLVRDVHADVLLLDDLMPLLSGVEALPLIVRAAPRLRVIIFTGHAAGDRALEAGAVAVFEKPMDIDRLLDALRAAVNESTCSETGTTVCAK
jgi:NarL family two-component system response regulator LiaR